MSPRGPMIGMPSLRTFSVVVIALLAGAAPVSARSSHPLEQRLRDQFPTISLHTTATLESNQEIVGSSVISGLRAHFARPHNTPPDSGGPGDVIQVSFPRLYSDPLVATAGQQRVVLRSIRARGSVAEEAD